MKRVLMVLAMVSLLGTVQAQTLTVDDVYAHVQAGVSDTGSHIHQLYQQVCCELEEMGIKNQDDIENLNAEQRAKVEALMKSIADVPGEMVDGFKKMSTVEKIVVGGVSTLAILIAVAPDKYQKGM